MMISERLIGKSPNTSKIIDNFGTHEKAKTLPLPKKNSTKPAIRAEQKS